MVELGGYHLKVDQICVDVPDLIDVVTSRLSIDPDVVFAQLSKEPGRRRSRRRKRDPRTGLRIPAEKKPTTKHWCNWQATQNTKRNRFATFINKITDNVRKLTSGGKWRKNEGDLVFMEKPKLLGPSTDLNEVPDFVLVERKRVAAKGLGPTWEDVHCVGSLKDDDADDLDKAVIELGEFARRCFSKGNEHRFILGLMFFIRERSMSFRLLVFDRTGTLCSQLFDMKKKPLEFLRGVICLPLLSSIDLGWDPTFLIRDDGTYFRVADEDYKILRNTFLNSKINGNCTRCYQVLGPDEKIYAARDSWMLRSDNFRETEFLDLIKDMKNVPRIVRQEIVLQISPEGDEPFLDNTEHMRTSLMQAKHENASGNSSASEPWMDRWWTPAIRDHVRTIISPCGQRLEDFASLSELVSAALDVLETVEELNDRGMLHADISPGNIILVPTEGATFRKGFLIDFETAVQRDSERFVTTNYFTIDTTSSEIILSGAKRTAVHEAESILYVLLYVALYLGGPRGKRREDCNGSFFELFASTSRYPYRGLHERKAILKGEVMHDAEYFESEVLDDIDPYFKPLKKCLASLREQIMAPEERREIKEIMKASRDDRVRLFEEWADRRTRAILKKCKEILHETLVELAGLEESDQPICDESHPPGDLVGGESKPVGKGQQGTEKCHIEQIETGTSVIQDEAISPSIGDRLCPSLANSDDMSNVLSVSEDTPSHTSPDTPPPLQNALKRPLPETEHTNQHGDIGCGMPTKRLRLSDVEVDCDT